MLQKVAQSKPLARQAILVVDDSPANLLAYTAVLEPLGHEIVTALSGREAVRLLAGRQFALLLIDVRMPDVDGFETVELLRGQFRRATPVIFVTGAGDDETMRRAYEFGAVDYLVKPVDPLVLRGKVRNLLALYEQGLELERRSVLLIEQQEQLAKADAAMQRQDTNIGIVAHDLRNPLGSIVAGVNLLLRIADLPEQARIIAERIDRSAGRMALMIRDILDFTRGRLGGGIPLNRQDVDLTPLCASIVDEVESAHPSAKIDVRVGGDPRGSWDRARIEQALSNLLANAVQHGGGGVTLSLSDGQREHVVITVQNGGTPIPPDQLPQVFDAFRKGDKSPAGLGLGLFIVREIVQAHGGTIEAASSSEGTIFTMRLPRHDGPERSTSRASSARLSGEGHPAPTSDFGASG